MNKRIALWLGIQTAAVIAFLGGLPARLEAAQRGWKMRARVGNHSTDVVLWVVGSIVVAGVILAAVKAFVDGKIALFK